MDVRLLFEVNLALGAGRPSSAARPGRRGARRGRPGARAGAPEGGRRSGARGCRACSSGCGAGVRPGARARETAGELVSDDERSGDEEEAPAVHGAEALGLGAGAGEDLLAGMEVFVDDKAAVTTARGRAAPARPLGRSRAASCASPPVLSGRSPVNRLGQFTPRRAGLTRARWSWQARFEAPRWLSSEEAIVFRLRQPVCAPLRGPSAPVHATAVSLHAVATSRIRRG